MLNQKLRNLQSFLQDASDTAFEFASLTSEYTAIPTTYDEHFQTILSARSVELSEVLHEIALEQVKKTQQPPEIDFSKYINYSTDYVGYIEVFTGNEWILVPEDSKVEFTTHINENERSFTVKVSHGEDYAVFTSTASANAFEYQNDYLGEKLDIQQVPTPKSYTFKEFGADLFNFTNSTIGLVDNTNTLFQEIPNSVKRHYAYKISKTTKALGNEVKAGKIFQATKKLSKSKGLKVLGPIGDILSIGNIAYEVSEDKWDAHTAVDGMLLAVGVVAVAFEAPVIITGLAIYGILDFAFDFGDIIDENFGRDSELWKEKPIYQYHRNNEPLFNKVAIDNTYVAPRFKITPKFKK